MTEIIILDLSRRVFRGITEILGILCMFGVSDRVTSEPVPEPVTSASLTDVRYVGVIIQGGADSCMGTFITRKFLATSCRCLGVTDEATASFTKLEPTDFEVRTWGKGPPETQKAEKFYFYDMCGIEPSKVLLDLGLVKTAQPFSTAAATPIGLPNASVFRFHEYIYASIVKKTVCVSTTLNDTIAAPGETVPVQIRQPYFCRYRVTCRNQAHILKGNCVLPTLSTNHICGRAATNCAVTAGAPLVCHGMLMGINAGTKSCTGVINPSLYMRMDFTMTWIQKIACEKNV